MEPSTNTSSPTVFIVDDDVGVREGLCDLGGIRRHARRPLRLGVRIP